MTTNKLMCGMWVKNSTEGGVRKDGHYQRDRETITLWLRADGLAQYEKESSWTSYVGDTEKGVFGGGITKESIRATIFSHDIIGYLPRPWQPKQDESFLTDPNSPADGIWTISEGMLELKGNGYFTNAASENSNLWCNDSGRKSGVTFEIPLVTLRQEYNFTPIHELLPPEEDHYSPISGARIVESMTPYICSDLCWIHGEALFSLIIDFLIHP